MKNCPECGAPSPVHCTRDVSYTYKGHMTVIAGVKGFHCRNCGEVTLDRDAVDRYGDLVERFQHSVDQMPEVAGAAGSAL